MKEVLENTWSKAYRYKVYNRVGIAVTNLKKRLHSHMIIAGTRVLITYEGKPPTWYDCDEQGYLNQDCPRLMQIGTQRGDTYKHSWANVVTQRPRRQQSAAMSDTSPSQQSVHEVGMTYIVIELPSRQEDHSAPAKTADEKS